MLEPQTVRSAKMHPDLPARISAQPIRITEFIKK